MKHDYIHVLQLRGIYMLNSSFKCCS